jgi:hypothetical protein
MLMFDGGRMYNVSVAVPPWRGYQRVRVARGAWWTTIRFLKLYGEFSSLFMVKNGSETPRHGEPWELGDGYEVWAHVAETCDLSFGSCCFLGPAVPQPFLPVLSQFVENRSRTACW